MSVPLKAQAARSLERFRSRLVEQTVDTEFKQRPDFWTRYGEKGRVRCTEDTNFHLNFLVCALVMDSPNLFTDYVGWLVPLLEGYGMGEDDVRQNMECLKHSISGSLPLDEAQAACSVIDAALSLMSGGTPS